MGRLSVAPGKVFKHGRLFDEAVVKTQDMADFMGQGVGRQSHGWRLGLPRSVEK